MTSEERSLPIITRIGNSANLEHWFICPLCNGRLNNPHIMPACTHRFCGPCIRAWTRASKNTNNVCPRCREVSHDNWTFDPLVNAFLKVYSENQLRSEENIQAVISSPIANGDLPTLPNQETGASSGTRVKHKTSNKRPANSFELPVSQKGPAQQQKKAKVDQRDLSRVPQKSLQVTEGVINHSQGEDAAKSNVLPDQNEIALEAYSIACKTAAKEANALAEKYPSSWEAGFTGPQRPSGYAVVYLYEDMIPNVERNSSTQGSWDIAVLTCPAHATMAQIKANISYAIKCDARKLVIDICNRLKSNESFLDACRQIGAGKWCLKDSLTIRDLTLLLADVRENLRLEWSRQS